GGTTVIISGSNLSGVTAVSFGSTLASSFSYNAAAGTISALAPGGSVGSVYVAVTTGGGTSAQSSASQFIYTNTFALEPSPSSQTVNPGKRTSYSLTLTALGGYSAPVSLAVAGLPN